MAQLQVIDRATNRVVNMTLRQALARPGTYSVVIPTGAVGANKVFFDMFNTDTANTVMVHDIRAEIVGSVAVVGVLAVDLTTRRTSAIGTGGAVATPTKFDTQLPNLPAGITVRAAPAGGATAAGDIAFASLFTEETGPGTYLSSLLNLLPGIVTLRANEGISVVQGAVASVGNVAFVVTFSIEAV